MSIKIHAQYRPWQADIGIFIVEELNGVRRALTAAVFNPTSESAPVPLAMSIDPEAAQVLVNQLWECGIRPTAAKGSVGQLDAVTNHLADMRQIAFAKIEVPKP